MKSSPKLVVHPEQPAQRRILAALRSQIMTGKLAPGAQLPSARELAVRWKSNSFTIHTILTTLAKEGWLERRPGSGTYIADPKNRFVCAGIYHDAATEFNLQNAFTRSLHFSLLKGFERLKKDTQVFIDSRPEKEQRTMLPALVEAIRNRRIQCLAALTLNVFNTPSLTRVTIPSVFCVSSSTPRWVDYDMEAMLRDSVKRLAAHGCRSVGLISNLSGHYHIYHDAFERAVREQGLVLHDEKEPNVPLGGLETHGYRQFKRLWSLRNKPDGLLVFPDIAVHGVILAILETGMHTVVDRMKFVFHRNAHIPVLCPFPVTWAIADEEVLAEGYIQMIQRQFRKEKITPSLIPFTFKEEITLA